MIQIMYEYSERWPEQGSLAIKTPSIDLQIPVSPETARRRANGYLGLNVGILLDTYCPKSINSGSCA